MAGKVRQTCVGRQAPHTSGCGISIRAVHGGERRERKPDACPESPAEPVRYLVDLVGPDPHCIIDPSKDLCFSLS